MASPLPIDDDDAGIADGIGAESDLTNLVESEADINGTPKASSSKTTIVIPSPRRLRSKSSKDVKSVGTGRGYLLEEADTAASLEVDRRVTPARKAKGRVSSPREDSECLAEDEDVEIPDAEEAEEDEEAEDEEAEEDEITSNDEEVDQLVSSPSPTPPPLRGRRTPVKRRLRPRRVQTYTPPSDGDDEEEEVEGSVTASEGEVYEDAEEAPASTTPRTLRSGRIVGEDEEDTEEEDEEEEGIESAESVDMDAEGETEEESDEPMDDGRDISPPLHILRI